MNSVYLQFIKYILVGLLNSAVGLAVIYGCMAIGLNDVIANAVGYLVGFCVSFTMNSKWTFRQRGDPAAVARFLLVTSVAYAANLGTMLATRDVLHVDHRLAQLAGMVAYTLVGFVGAKVYAFRIKHNAPQ